MLFKPAR
jgi:hypothetical protein